MMPFFNQPLPPRRGGPSALTRIIRWILMMIISASIGAALGAVIYYQFPHVAARISESILRP
jgi:hypothetical protein